MNILLGYVCPSGDFFAFSPLIDIVDVSKRWNDFEGENVNSNCDCSSILVDSVVG